MSTTVRSLPEERASCSLLAFLFEVEPFYSIDGLTPIHAHILSFLSHRRILAYLWLLHPFAWHHIKTPLGGRRRQARANK